MNTGGGDGGAAAEEQQAEASREALRQRINAMFGMDSPAPPPAAPPPVSRGFTDDIVNAVRSRQAGSPVAPPPSTAPVAAGARGQLEAEKKRLSQATSDYYTDKLGQDYSKASRQNKFGLARRGLLGGSVEADTGASLTGDLEAGATRVGEAARRAASGLDVAREQQRLQAIQLANSGAGESSVNAASAGLRNAFAGAESAAKPELFGDLFSAGAIQSQMNSAANDPRIALMRKHMQPFYPTTPTTARETASW